MKIPNADNLGVISVTPVFSEVPLEEAWNGTNLLLIMKDGTVGSYDIDGYTKLDGKYDSIEDFMITAGLDDEGFDSMYDEYGEVGILLKDVQKRYPNVKNIYRAIL